MKTPFGAWRVTYTPGRWVVLSGPTSLVIMQPAPSTASQLFASLWDKLLTSSSISQVGEVLAAAGLDSMPNLAVFFWDDEQVHCLLRGDIKVLDADTAQPLASGSGARTWFEVSLTSKRICLRLDDVDPSKMLQLPMVVGGVQASVVFLDATEQDGPQLIRTAEPEGVPAGLEEPLIPIEESAPAGVAGIAAARASGSNNRPMAPMPPDRVAAGEVKAAAGPTPTAPAPAPSPSEPVPPPAAPVPQAPAPVPSAPVPSAPKPTPPPPAPTPKPTTPPAGAVPGAPMPGPAAPVPVAPPPISTPMAPGPNLPAAPSGVIAPDGPAAAKPASSPEGAAPASPPTAPPPQSPAGTQQPVPTMVNNGPATHPQPAAVRGKQDFGKEFEAYLPQPDRPVPNTTGPWGIAGFGSASSPVNAGVPIGGASPVPEPPSIPNPPRPSTSVRRIDAAADHDGETVYADNIASTHKPAAGRNENNLILAALCPSGHANKPGSGQCRVCGGYVESHNPQLVNSPLLTILETPTGDRLPLNCPILIGRAPTNAGNDLNAELLRIPSPNHDVSRTHMRIAPHEWVIEATDLYSTNGTIVITPGGKPMRLEPGQTVEIAVGTRLDLGDGQVVTLQPPA